jgi:hypothetical protein
MEHWGARSESDKLRWELVIARIGGELDALVDEDADCDARELAAGAVFDLYCSIVARAQELEAFAETWSADDPLLAQRLDAIRLKFPLPIPSWDERMSGRTR